MAQPTIQVGSTGDAVKDAQHALQDRGYHLGPAGVDGVFGMHTLRSVLDYQDDRSAGSYSAYTWPLVVDGIVGPQTWGRLQPATIKNGARSSTVRLLQRMLKDSGWPEWDPGAVDGVFGAQTELALLNYQKFNGLDSDGVAGPRNLAGSLELSSRRCTRGTRGRGCRDVGRIRPFANAHRRSRR